MDKMDGQETEKREIRNVTDVKMAGGKRMRETTGATAGASGAITMNGRSGTWQGS